MKHAVHGKTILACLEINISMFVHITDKYITFPGTVRYNNVSSAWATAGRNDLAIQNSSINKH